MITDSDFAAFWVFLRMYTLAYSCVGRCSACNALNPGCTLSGFSGAHFCGACLRKPKRMPACSCRTPKSSPIFAKRTINSSVSPGKARRRVVRVVAKFSEQILWHFQTVTLFATVLACSHEALKDAQHPNYHAQAGDLISLLYDLHKMGDP
jgi:hypothetical protein